MRDAPQDDEGLVAGLAGELEWTRDRLVALGAEVLGMTLVVIDAVGLTPRALKHMPRVSKLGADGFQARAGPDRPGRHLLRPGDVLTGLTPTDHGIVGNGWYFRDLGEVFLWRQHNKLVQGEKVWETARRAKPGFRAANLCWWYAMGASTDLTVTPRPIYHADGAQVARLLHVPAAAARQPDRPARRVPAVPVLGPDGEHQVHQVDRRRGEDRARQRAARPAARLPAAPRLRPPALRARGRPRR